jgi:hypothetical protein
MPKDRGYSGLLVPSRREARHVNSIIIRRAAKIKSEKQAARTATACHFPLLHPMEHAAGFLDAGRRGKVRRTNEKSYEASGQIGHAGRALAMLRSRRVLFTRDSFASPNHIAGLLYGIAQIGGGCQVFGQNRLALVVKDRNTNHQQFLMNNFPARPQAAGLARRAFRFLIRARVTSSARTSAHCGCSPDWEYEAFPQTGQSRCLGGK